MRSKQPNSRSCFVCGVSNPIGLQLKFYSIGPGEVTAEYIVPEQYQGYPGVVHGGIVAAMLDEICMRAHMNETSPRYLVTARLDVRYRQNVPVGKPLRMEGKANKSKTRAATASGRIYGPDGIVLAEAEALLVEAPKEMLDMVDLEALGWKVYND